MRLGSAGKRWLSAALVSLGLQAQANPDEAVFAWMHAKLAASFTPPSTLGAGPAYLILMPVGFGLSQEQVQDPYDLAVLLDQVPSPSRSYVPSGKLFSDLYARILGQASASAYQNQADRNQARLARLQLVDRRRPGKPSPMYAAYLQAQAAYGRALDARTVALAEHEASGQEVPPGLNQAVERAMNNWLTLGHKQAIEAAIATVDAFNNNNVAAFLADLTDTIRTAGRGDGHAMTWFPFQANPDLATWLTPQDWVTWHFQSSDRQILNPPSALPDRPPVTAKETGNRHEWLTTLAMTAQVKRVTITRPWLDPGLFRNHAWTLQNSGDFSMVASGDPHGPGLMPQLVTGVLLAKDVVVSGSWSGGASASAPTAVGPFALATPAATPGLPLHPYVTTEDGSLLIRTDGTQIIGFFCEPVPRSPSPDPRYFLSR